MQNYWHVWYDLSYDSIRATIRHIIFSVYNEIQKETLLLEAHQKVRKT
jgi:hypothetical protein